MDGELVRLTGTEWAVLDCLWEASTCRQGERAKWYAPAVERRAAVVSETRSFLRRICRESVSVLTNAAAEPERLSREEIDALYDVLKGLEEKEHG